MKLILINEDQSVMAQLKPAITQLHTELLGVFPANQAAIAAILQHKPDLVLLEPALALAAVKALLAKDGVIAAKRQHLSASTHQGLQLLPVLDVIYFQAELKYVIAHHAAGELLITEPLASLEREFADLFLRIHRKYLVAKSAIKSLEKTADGAWQLALTSCPDKLMVSRRQLSVVRKWINAYASS